MYTGDPLWCPFPSFCLWHLCWNALWDWIVQTLTPRPPFRSNRKQISDLVTIGFNVAIMWWMPRVNIVGTLQQFETVPAEPKVVCYQGISHGTVIAQRFLALAVDFSSYPVYCLVTFFNNNNFFFTFHHSVESLTGCASGCSLLTHWGDNDTLDHITGDIFVIWFVAPTGAPFTLSFVQVYSVHPSHQKKSLLL